MLANLPTSWTGVEVIALKDCSTCTQIPTNDDWLHVSWCLFSIAQSRPRPYMRYLIWPRWRDSLGDQRHDPESTSNDEGGCWAATPWSWPSIRMDQKCHEYLVESNQLLNGVQNWFPPLQHPPSFQIPSNQNNPLYPLQLIQATHPGWWRNDGMILLLVVA